MIDTEVQEIIKAERKRIYDRWMEIHKEGRRATRDFAASLTLEELARQEHFPPHDKNK